MVEDGGWRREIIDLLDAGQRRAFDIGIVFRVKQKLPAQTGTDNQIGLNAANQYLIGLAMTDLHQI